MCGSARRLLEPVQVAAESGASNPHAMAGPSVTATPEQQSLAIYEESTARAVAILRRNGRMIGRLAQPARQAAMRVLWEARQQVREVFARAAQRHAAEAASVAPGSDHWMRAHAACLTASTVGSTDISVCASGATLGTRRLRGCAAGFPLSSVSPRKPTNPVPGSMIRESTRNDGFNFLNAVSFFINYAAISACISR